MASKSRFLPSSEVHDELIDSGTVPQARLRPKTCPREGDMDPCKPDSLPP